MNAEFQTDQGIVVPAVTTEQMREVDRIAVEETGPNLYQMMENAGRNLAGVAIEMLLEGGPGSRILVLARTGGNGGGGICAARHLANRGIPVALCLADAVILSEVAKWQYRVFRATPGELLSSAKLNGQRFAVIIDALIGYSLTGSPHGRFVDLIRWANCSSTRILSLDVPSGMDSTTGAVSDNVIAPHTTMTLALPKTGLSKGAGGRLLLADIGIPFETYRRLNLPYAAPFENEYVVPLHIRNGAAR
jgi:NAD(P)H-hydrate epimerase